MSLLVRPALRLAYVGWAANVSQIRAFLHDSATESDPPSLLLEAWFVPSNNVFKCPKRRVGPLTRWARDASLERSVQSDSQPSSPLVPWVMPHVVRPSAAP